MRTGLIKQSLSQRRFFWLYCRITQEYRSYRLLRQDAEQVHWKAFAWRKPFLKIFWVQDDRLAIVEFPHDAVRLARKSSERLFPSLRFRVSPLSRHSRYSKELAIENRDLIFRFRTLLGVFPFEE